MLKISHPNIIPLIKYFYSSEHKVDGKEVSARSPPRSLRTDRLGMPS
jgi:hypothetical protein